MFEDDNISGTELEDDFYTILNLPKNATNEEINFAYRKLSRIYHPDKHTDPEKKKNAGLLFNRIKRAYEVLSDDHQRAIYDSVGEKGLRTEGWELVHRTKTPAEIREEYERLAQAQAEAKLQQRTNPRGNMTLSVNATELFSPYDVEEAPRIEISQMSISQSIEAPVSLRDTIILEGNLASSNGNGHGNVMISGRRFFEKGWMQLETGAGNGPILGLKGGRTIASKYNLSGGSSLRFMGGGAVPTLFTALGLQLDKRTVGTLTLNVIPNNSSLTTQVDHNNEAYTWSTSLVIGTPHIYFTIAYTRKMLENELKLKLAAKGGTFGFLVEYGAEKKVSKHSSVLASISLGVPTGVMLKLKLTRSSQTYVVPIYLSEEIVPAAVFYATITPVILWFVIKKTIIDPLHDERKRLKVERTRRNNEQRLIEKREQAKIAIDLMQNTYQRIVAEEQECNGLIIEKAVYGQLKENSDELFIESACIDVTIPLQCLVKDSKLILHRASKSELPGFYDPCIGEEKRLRIQYTHRNQQRTIMVKEEEALCLP